MKIYENLWKSMEVYGNLWKSKDICVLKKENDYILHISVLEREIYSLNKENENHDFPENMDSDLQIAYQSHYFYENLKWSHGHYGHFAPAGFP